MGDERNRIYPQWQVALLAFWPWVVALLFIAFSIGLYLLSERIETRLEAIEDKVAETMPPPYTRPDLADHLADDADRAQLAAGATVYVPVYSHVYVQGGRPFLLEATLSIRNVDPDDPVYVASVEYYDSAGRPVETFVDELMRLGPLETIDFVVEQEHTAGGAGANFLVSWRAAPGVERPLIESVMAGHAGQHSLSFAREGRTLGGTP